MSETSSKKIGVDQRITTLGQSSEYKEFAEKEDFIGWYYSLEGLATLGISSIDIVNPFLRYYASRFKTKIAVNVLTKRRLRL